MSALPIILKQRSESVGLFTHTRERVLLPMERLGEVSGCA